MTSLANPSADRQLANNALRGPSLGR